MKDFFVDALMLIVGCLLWVIWAALTSGLAFLPIWIIYQVIEFSNYWSLFLLFALAVGLALIITIFRFLLNFWQIYCE